MGQLLLGPGRRERTESWIPLARYWLAGTHPDKGDWGPSGSQEPRPAHVPPLCLYLHVTQLHAQIQLAVPLSPVDVRRQHLILHDHTAQGAGRLGSLPQAGRARLELAEHRPQDHLAPECLQPAASIRPTLAGRACAVASRGGSGAGSGLQGEPGGGGAGRGGGGRGRAQERVTPLLAAAASRVDRCCAVTSLLLKDG